jgi:hypothetical protein
VTAHDLNALIVAIIVIATIVSRLSRLRGRFSKWAADQQVAAQQAIAKARQAAAAEIAAQQAAAAAAQQAALQRGAVTPARSSATPAYANQPARTQPAAAPRRIPPPAMRSTAVPVLGAGPDNLRPGAVLAQAFADPAHARDAVILAEVLGKPLSLR